MCCSASEVGESRLTDRHWAEHPETHRFTVERDGDRVWVVRRDAGHGTERVRIR